MSSYPHIVSYFSVGEEVMLTENDFRSVMNRFFDDDDANLRVVTLPPSRKLLVTHYWYNVILPHAGENIPWVNIHPVPEFMRLYSTNNFVASIMASESQNHLNEVSRKLKSQNPTNINLDF